MGDPPWCRFSILKQCEHGCTLFFFLSFFGRNKCLNRELRLWEQIRVGNFHTHMEASVPFIPSIVFYFINVLIPSSSSSPFSSSSSLICCRCDPISPLRGQISALSGINCYSLLHLSLPRTSSPKNVSSLKKMPRHHVSVEDQNSGAVRRRGNNFSGDRTAQ